ncbi:hypothetical protein [Asticcacaulis excentricus]|jgi:hypothetical protein|uniref:DUF7832 domain-containing protein n=1 Tax=Asticcacaulis excentricus TaxID=78587 RepID=A0A3G9FYR2_9CAUL|nr:hypothetical protein [Asticcacaulis excentricus]BBF79486.1 hypothetical protein EM6_0052 [Asticcacaulis excentricus]
MDYSEKAYDKAKWHFESIEKEGLDEIQAYVHTAFFWRWIVDQNLTDKRFEEDFEDDFSAYRNGSIDALEFYRVLDGCLIGDMMNDEGNAFASHYFDFQTGQYLRDYERAVAHDRPSIFQVTFNDETYDRIKPYIEKAYSKWKTPKAWWRFW